ncbi:unnamed protein product [Rhizoctonia solani]|uniref:Uncharacterized protein n=1 Tax=Rhizoctonia solani TaxID=456999 RepID=A0A8H3HMU1_9AGAM|nr:unnamed protein product [Rhizoctonia solani]
MVVQIPGIVAIVCSLCLIIICLWPIVTLRSSLPAKQLWIMNTKDAFRVGVLSSKPRLRGLSILGQPCEAKSSPKPFVLIARDTRRFLAHLLFRRVRPVETRIYAFARNLFAVFAIGVLIFRTVTALQQAQNEVGTRVVSDSCDLIPYEHRILVLSERLLYDPQWNTSLPADINFTISAIWSDPGRGYEPYKGNDCSLIWNKTLRKRILLYYGSTAYQNRSLELFDCPVTFGQRSNRPWPWLFAGGGNMTDSFVYRIEARPVTGTTEGRLVDTQMPHIWLINQRELNSTDFDQSNVGEIRTHLPAFKLLRGSSIAAEANLVTRRLIQSSIVKDTIFQSKPDYRLLSLYPIVQSSVAMLNSSDANVAIATVRPTLNPALMYHRSPSNVIDPDDPLKGVCDFIDDYRTGTIFNVIGSVGGLFALLQAMHMLLFGRPLLWGLTGAKTITPFGLLGTCSSGGFKRRLRDEYHTTSDEDGTDAIRISKFLRDFVVDFGPADLDMEKPPNTEKMLLSSTLVAESEDIAGPRITNAVHQKGDGTEEVANQTNGRDHTRNIV